MTVASMKTYMDIIGAVRDVVGRSLPAELRTPEARSSETPYTVVATRGPMRVLYYEPRGKVRHASPVLFVYSLINRYHILDFLPGRSLLEYLTGQGHACYVIDWGTPSTAERHKTYADYVLGYIGDAVRTVCDREQVDQVTMYGYCMGGTLGLAYAALRPSKVRAFVAMATPVDFHDNGLLSLWTRPRFFDVNAMVNAYGNVPTWLMESGFRWLNPLTNVTRWRDLWKNRERDRFVEIWRAMERWSSDNVPFPGEVYRQYVRDCYQENRFCKSEMVLDGEPVVLSNINMPLLVIAASNDHIAPRSSTVCLMDLAGGDEKTLMEFPTGHIGLSTSSKAPIRYWPKISEWMATQRPKEG